jgi:GNAT superfamily N-acetyltransferase
MWRPDRRFIGPETPGPEDIEPLNRVFAESFTDRYRRDGMPGVRVPHLNPLVWRYAIEGAGGGAMVWRDGAGEIVAFNIVHRSGREGWMGPLAVRPDRQNQGLGKTIVLAGIDWLREEGATTIGLETMPRTVENIGFYSRLGFVPGHLTVTVTREPGRRGASDAGRLSRLRGPIEPVIAACGALCDRLTPGLDFSREILLTRDLGLGDTSLVYAGERLRAFAVWHAAALADGRSREDVRVLKVVAESLDDFEAVLEAVSGAAASERVQRIAIRCQTAQAAAYRRLVDRGYEAFWTDLRMTLDGYPEPAPGPGVIFSNWEI